MNKHKFSVMKKALLTFWKKYWINILACVVFVGIILGVMGFHQEKTVGPSKYYPASDVAISLDASSISSSSVSTSELKPSFLDTSLQNTPLIKSSDAASSSDAIPPTSTTPAVYYVNVVNGSGSGFYSEGDVVRISANGISGKLFYTWKSDTVSFIDPKDTVTSFIMPDYDVSIIAEFADYEDLYTVTVSNGTGSGNYKDGDTVVISANEAPSGTLFYRWESDYVDVHFEDQKAETTTFLMPNEDVSMTATYKKIDNLHYVTVKNGTGSGFYAPGDNVTISADTKDGYAFTKWDTANDIELFNPEDKQATFIMIDSYVTVVANYEKSDSICTCTLDINCTPFISKVSDSIKAKLPSDGVMLGSTPVEFYEGDTVYNVLSRACAAKGIPISASATSYGVYIKSIDNLSEKYYDYSTGWCYTVNGVAPQVSADNYVLQSGDVVSWTYDAWSY